jgi:hypothetical protein
MHPAYLDITKITCVTTEDTIGSDDLYGILGAVKFSLGSYNAGDVRTAFDEVVIGSGVTELTIAESDLVDPDDMLGTIDLTQDMDVDRIFGILSGSARYDIEFKVISADDDVTADACPSTCPTCGGACLKRSSHGGTVHWCGKHEWGAN